VPDVDPGEPGDAPACKATKSREYSQKRNLDVTLGSKTRLAFHVDLPDPSLLRYASLSMRLYDADHPRQEGTIHINRNGPLSVPARTSWNNREADAKLGVPLQYLKRGENLIEFGAGTLPRTYYSVSRVAVTVYGELCAPTPPTPSPDSGPPASQDAAPDAGVAADASLAESDPDAWMLPAPVQDRPVQADPTSEDSSTDDVAGGCSNVPAPPSWPQAISLLGLLVLVRRTSQRQSRRQT
jgi:hypothetical protein